ncbi:hypothetical protein CVIRNUC_003465 [Coccomyxa viridis]|uniref:XdhC- CoxI domain-containing protein n=1 Tax=Coccomyxa viridis TaxID=1274662 RepID=A0AAV1I2G3_9CHLO|nr:hypothetical protein CVIRNUC_003465 [Coccomyxa viridis]
MKVLDAVEAANFTEIAEAVEVARLRGVAAGCRVVGAVVFNEKAKAVVTTIAGGGASGRLVSSETGLIQIVEDVESTIERGRVDDGLVTWAVGLTKEPEAIERARICGSACGSFIPVASVPMEVVEDVEVAIQCGKHSN